MWCLGCILQQVDSLALELDSLVCKIAKVYSACSYMSAAIVEKILSITTAAAGPLSLFSVCVSSGMSACSLVASLHDKPG